MSENDPIIEEIDLERHMDDHASRIEMVSFVQNRLSAFQKIWIKAQTLSDKDFDNAFSTFESVVETLNQKKQKSENFDKSSKQKISNFITTSKKN